jgi:hypothetical protein
MGTLAEVVDSSSVKSDGIDSVEIDLAEDGEPRIPLASRTSSSSVVSSFGGLRRISRNPCPKLPVTTPSSLDLISSTSNLLKSSARLSDRKSRLCLQRILLGGVILVTASSSATVLA